MKEIIDAIATVKRMKQKFHRNEKLTIEELEKLFILYQIEENSIALTDPRFKYDNFRQLYNIYNQDLSFKGIFYKRNFNKRVSDYIDFRILEKINQEEYDPEKSQRLRDFFIINKLIVPIDTEEIKKDKLQLENSAKDWALVCLNEKHTDEDLKVIAKETRDTLRKKKIEDYLNNSIQSTESKDTFKGLLKTYYIFHESKKTIDKINELKQPNIFFLNDVKIEINLYSFIHIMNRHFAEILSPQYIVDTKTFHNPKINPYNIHLFIDDLFKKIKVEGIENKIEIKKGKSILINFHGLKYALFFNEYKQDKSKIILETFFVIESGSKSAQILIDKIEKSAIIKLDNDLSIYL